MKHLVKNSGSYRIDGFIVLKIPVLPSFRVEHLLEKLGDFESVPSPAAVAEWLRRLTRNQFPFGSVGSNPADCEIRYVDVYPSGFFTGEKSSSANYVTTVHLHSTPFISA